LPDLSRLLGPRSVAVVGASTAETKPGHILFRNILDGGYDGALYPINPNATKLAGLPAYPSILHAPRDVDLAFIVLPRTAVYDALVECADAGVGAVCIITAGFGEGDEWGKEEEHRIKSLVRQRHLIAIGPNTIGLVTMGGKMRGTFVQYPSWADGDVAIIAQTGIYAGAVVRELMDQRVQRLGITASVDIGNRVGLSEIDLLAEFSRQAQVKVIGCYLEEFTNGREFLARAADAKVKKPIVVLKPGRTAEGIRASASHTGALSGEGTMLDDLLAQHGLVRASDSEELLYLLRGFSMCPVAGRRVGLVTYSGALGVIATDQAVDAGLSIAPLGAATTRELETVMPGWQVPNNPVDLWSAAEIDAKRAAAKGFGAVLEDQGVDQVLGIILAVPAASFDGVGTLFAEMRSRLPQKPLHLVMKGPLAEPWTTELEGLGIPVYRSTAEAVRTMAALASYGERRAHIPVAHTMEVG
jgi:acetate---CoA ligase (ADP-forming)